MKYLINKSKVIKKVVKVEAFNEGYKFTPKSSLNISEINVIDENLIDNILTSKISKVFEKLLKSSLNVISDEDATDEDIFFVLGEIQRLREVILAKYHNFLNIEKEELFLKKLRSLENELKAKVYSLSNVEELSRGSR